jgi:fibronectin type 3 domain-containing protein
MLVASPGFSGAAVGEPIAKPPTFCGRFFFVIHRFGEGTMNIRRGFHLLVLVTMLFSLFAYPGGGAQVQAAPAGTALQFNGSSQYVPLGLASGLGISTFTLEAWIKRASGGKSMGTGTAGLGDTGLGLPQAYPVLTKGRGQAESPANLNMNYWLGIATTGVIAADFEDTYNGLNHPILGTSSIPIGEWHHIAVTYSLGCWNVYLDGNPEGIDSKTTRCPLTAEIPGKPAIPESTSIQHAAISTALQSSGTLPSDSGYFSGVIDEARIWNRALSVTEIFENKYIELSSGTGLIARWGMNEGNVSTIINSSIGTFQGTLMPVVSPPTWVTGFPDNVPPAAPSALTASGIVGEVNLSWTAPADTDLAGYNVYRGTTTEFPLTTPLNSGLVSGVTYSDVTGIVGTPYFYVVKAVDTSGNSSTISNEATATPLADTTPPAAPSGLTAMPGDHQLTLNWTANTEGDKAGYNVYLFTEPSTYTKLNTIPLANPSYTPTNLTNGTTYTYTVTCVDTHANESLHSATASATPAEFGLQFDGVDDYVTFGPTLNTTNFTLEAWVNRSSGGVTMTTGSLGLDGALGRPFAYPVLTKGMGEGDSVPNKNMNYFLGITDTGVIGADFEDNSGGVNHPAWGSTTISIGAWHHIAATYNGSCWALYLDGKFETLNGLVTTCPNATPEFTSIQHAGLAAGIGSSGQLSTGFFSGKIDEARVWSVARTMDQIRTDINHQLTSGTNLVARWGMIEGSGTTTASSVGTFSGTLTNGPTWVTPGAPFNLVLDTTPPAAPTGLSATAGLAQVTLNWSTNSEPDKAGYNVYRGTSPSVPITSPINGGIPVTNPTYVDTGRTNGTTYYYAVTAVDTSGNQSGASNEVSATPFADSTPPAAPTLLTAIGRNASVTLDWADNSEPDLAGYNVYRRTSTGVYTKVNTLLVIASSYTDAGLTNLQEYYYVVTAVDASNNESGNSNEAYAIPMSDLGSAVQFDGVDDYVTFGPASGLGAQNFTLETWFMRTGTGVSSTTGGGGIPDLVPLMAKGAQEVDAKDNRDENYILGIRASDNVLAGDFETYTDGCNSRLGGDNNPIAGVTPIVNDTWYHAAFTYDGTALKLYLNGKLEKTLLNTCLPRYDSIQHAALGSMLNSTGGRNGFFQGVLDEPRIWNVAVTQGEILANINKQLTSDPSGTRLLARWGLNEGSGTTITSSVGTFSGTLSPDTGGPTWVPSAPFNLDLKPAVPTLVVPANAATDIPTSTTLTVHVNDAYNSNQTVSFYGRPKTGEPGADFSFIAIPDAQYYASTYPLIYNAQMDWVVNNKTTRNIAYVASLGDNVDNSSISTQWDAATTAWDILTTGGVPYGLTLGNHDGAPSSTTNFNAAFAASLSGQSTFGGRYGDTDYDNRYALFSASGMDFIVLFIEYDPGMNTTSHPVLTWANEVLAANSGRRAIVVTHDLLSGNNFSGQGSAIYEALKANPNLFLMLGGHLDTTGQRSDTYNGHTVYSLRSDYQFVGGQQSGYLRILRFSPANNKIYVTTYSPNHSTSLTDAANQFELPYIMASAPAFTQVDSTTAPSGTDASVTWSGLSNSKEYEWYAVASNSADAAASLIWRFTTAAPTAVDLVDFTGATTNGTVQLDWQTASELNLVGFNLYRAETLTGERTRLNADQIQALHPGQMVGDHYQYIDQIDPGQPYYYWLELVNQNGATTTSPILVGYSFKAYLPMLIH